MKLLENKFSKNNLKNTCKQEACVLLEGLMCVTHDVKRGVSHVASASILLPWRCQ